jgi:hypothetical protein
LKLKNHSLAIAFNDPKENTGTTIDLNLFLGGKSVQDTLNELSWLTDTGITSSLLTDAGITR